MGHLRFPDTSLIRRVKSMFRRVENSAKKAKKISGLHGVPGPVWGWNRTNSLFFPCITGNSAETGSLKTPCTVKLVVTDILRLPAGATRTERNLGPSGEIFEPRRTHCAPFSFSVGLFSLSQPNHAIVVRLIHA